MEHKIGVLSKILDFPYAIFKSGTCVWKTDVDNTAILKNLSQIDYYKKNVILFQSHKDLLLFYINYEFLGEEFTLVILLKEEIKEKWSKKEWYNFYSSCHISAMVLSSSEPYNLKYFYDSDPPNFSITDFRITNSDEVSITTDFQDNFQLESDLISLFHKKSIKPIKALMQKIIQHTHHQTTLLSLNIINDKKYRLIALVTLLTREVLKNGCSAQYAYRLSDQLIFEIDRIESISDVDIILERVITKFFKLYHFKSNNYSHSLVNSTINYIHQNIYNEIRNTDIAEFLSIHPAYLSNIFKKFTGVPLHQFIINEKISEAKYLLSNTNFSYPEIAAILHFSNQSHFCKLFKDRTGLTPRNFRISLS